MKTLQFLFAFLILTLIYFTVQIQSRTTADDFDVIRTKKFELVDDKGRVRASILTEESGETVLRLRDQNGEIRVKIGASESGSGLLLLNGKTEPGIQALAGEKTTTITVTDMTGRKKTIEP